jgi:hypothetical protein
MHRDTTTASDMDALTHRSDDHLNTATAKKINGRDGFNFFEAISNQAEDTFIHGC